MTFPELRFVDENCCDVGTWNTHKHRQAMLYAAGVPDRHTMETAPQVGIASVWWEGNPCK
jgi:hypothetical protein